MSKRIKKRPSPLTPAVEERFRMANDWSYYHGVTELLTEFSEILLDVMDERENISQLQILDWFSRCNHIQTETMDRIFEARMRPVEHMKRRCAQ